jgi:iron complex outermembrane receptor protein
VQDRPYEGFPNATMDLTGNLAEFVNGRYRRDFEGGNLTATVYWDHIRHEMNGDGPDRTTGMGDMPSRQRAQDYGYRLQAEFTLADAATLRLGSELQGQTLDDVWAGAPAGMMDDFIDIDNASRVRLGHYAEWQKQWQGGWTTELGIRDDLVWMNAGPVQGYDGLDDQAARFNAAPRARFDDNIDATALAAFAPDDGQSYSLGLARKNRSPNFYERYGWNTNTIGMVGWFGDGNGYTGSPSLRPETAYTASLSAEWRGADDWEVKATPYYSDVRNYIGVETLCGPACSGMPASQLMFANHHARLYGADLSGSVRLSETIRLLLEGGLSHGQDLTAHTGLYHVMPVHGGLTLQHRTGNWTNALQLSAADAKNSVDTQRNEPATPGYGVLSASSAYRLEHWRFELAVRNLLDHRYADPLGGAWISAFNPMGAMEQTYRPLPAQGRSIDSAVTLLF